MKLHGDYEESKSHRFFVRMFGAVGFLLVGFYVITFVANVVGIVKGPLYYFIVLMVLGNPLIWYIQKGWKESKRLEQEWDKTNEKVG